MGHTSPTNPNDRFRVTIGFTEAPAVSISDVRVVEGTGPSASTVAVFTVSLSHPSDQPVVLATETSDGTATSPQDYPRPPASQV